ncbi:hypothetical protein JJC04_09905 [Flavobacterium covae]|nr:hypothetical protein [Flavobacterium covae]QYS90426.1 hypothetical protein JJC04_09905 [Flavobacterium covae]
MSLLGKLMKNKVLNNEFKHNSPTAPQFIFKEKYDFEKVKLELIQKHEISKRNQSYQTQFSSFLG